jgi:peptidoglycan-associated lipoprotein
MPPPKEEVRVTEQPVSAIPAEPQPAPPPSEAAPPPVAQAPAEPPPQAESAPPPAAQAPVEPQPTAPQIAQAPVEAQPTPPPSEAAPPPVLSLADALFDFDRFAIRDDAKPILEGNAKELRKLTGMRLLIEGHCDERGTRAYNLVLGERRAKSVKEYLIDLGITGEAIQITSFGKERPICTEHTEECYQRNRRAHFVLK